MRDELVCVANAAVFDMANHVVSPAILLPLPSMLNCRVKAEALRQLAFYVCLLLDRVDMGNSKS